MHKHPLYRLGGKRYNDLVPPTTSSEKHSRWPGADPLVLVAQSFAADHIPLLHVQSVNKPEIKIHRSNELCLRRDNCHLFLVS